MAAYLLFTIIFSAVDTIAQQDGNATKICSWRQPRAAVVRDALYLEGGQRMQRSWSNGAWGDCTIMPSSTGGALYQLNFSKSYDANVTTNLANLFDRIPENFADSSQPVYASGAMFANYYEFYTYGGQAVPYVNSEDTYLGFMHDGLYIPNSLATGADLGIKPIQVPGNITGYVTNGAAVSVPSESLGFYFGGMRSSNYSRLGASSIVGYDAATTAVNTMLKVDTSSYLHASWSEIQLPATVTTRAEASLVWLPVGSRGSLFVIGGVMEPIDLAVNNQLNDTQLARSKAIDPTFMTNITVYDIANDVWHVQPTVGETPPTIAQGCAVVAKDMHRSSYEIFVYGGYDNTNDGAPTDDVWILSVPTFVWVKGRSGDSRNARYGHVCAMPYPDQMVVVGGVAHYQGEIESGRVLDVFDLNTLIWTGSYDPTKWKQYQTPAVMVSAINNNNVTALSNGLEAMFETTYTGNVTTWPYKIDPKKKPKSVVVPVVASVVPVCVIAIAVAAWFIWKRKQRKVAKANGKSGSKVNGWLASQRTEKDLMSEGTTEIDDGLSPRFPEVQGDSYFKPRAPAEMESGHTSAVTSPGLRSMSEVPGSSPRLNELSDGTHPAQYGIRNHPMYPLSVDGHTPSTRSNTISSPSHLQHARGPSGSDAMASPTYIELPEKRSEEDLKHGVVPEDLDIHQTTSTSTIKPPTSTQIMPQTPVRSPMEISPSEGGFPRTPSAANRPRHTRNASSGSSAVSALSPNSPRAFSPSGPVDDRRVSGIPPKDTQSWPRVPDRSAYQENSGKKDGSGTR